MKKPFLLFCVTTLVAFAGTIAMAGSKGGSRTENWTVVKLTEGDKIIEYKVIESSRIGDERKTLKKNYDEDMKEWQDRKKFNPSAERPQKRLLTPVKTGFNTQEVAREYCDKLNEERKAKEKENEAGKEKVPVRRVGHGR
jgi:hypothetical protein